MNQQDKNRNDYISSNDICNNNNKRINNSIKNNIIHQSKVNQYIICRLLFRK